MLFHLPMGAPSAAAALARGAVQPASTEVAGYSGEECGSVSGSSAVAAVIVAAFLATTAESYIGAIFQDNMPWLTNELVNFIMTVIGAAVAIALTMLATAV